MTDTKQPAKTGLLDAIDCLPESTRCRVTKTALEVRASEKAPSMELSMKGNALRICFDCESTEAATLLQMADIGTRDSDFHAGLVGQIACLGSHNAKVDSTNSNFVLAIVRSVSHATNWRRYLPRRWGPSTARP